MHNAPKPQRCLYTSSETADKFTECKWLPSTLASSNAFPRIRKHKDTKWPTEQTDAVSMPFAHTNVQCRLSTMLATDKLRHSQMSLCKRAGRCSRTATVFGYSSAIYALAETHRSHALPNKSIHEGRTPFACSHMLP